LYSFNTKEESYTKETEIVNKDFLLREDVYNQKEGGQGGQGGWDHINRLGVSRSNKVKMKISKSLLGFKYSKEHKQMLKDNYWLLRNKDDYINHLKNVNKGVAKSDLHKESLSKLLKGHIHSDNTKNKISESRKKLNKMWVFNLVNKLNKYINKCDFPKYEKLGWLKGRKMKF